MFADNCFWDICVILCSINGKWDKNSECQGLHYFKYTCPHWIVVATHKNDFQHLYPRVQWLNYCILRNWHDHLYFVPRMATWCHMHYTCSSGLSVAKLGFGNWIKISAQRFHRYIKRKGTLHDLLMCVAQYFNLANHWSALIKLIGVFYN